VSLCVPWPTIVASAAVDAADPGTDKSDPELQSVAVALSRGQATGAVRESLLAMGTCAMGHLAAAREITGCGGGSGGAEHSGCGGGSGGADLGADLGGNGGAHLGGSGSSSSGANLVGGSGGGSGASLGGGSGSRVPRAALLVLAPSAAWAGAYLRATERADFDPFDRTPAEEAAKGWRGPARMLKILWNGRL
jgi:hypothetical protein